MSLTGPQGGGVHTAPPERTYCACGHATGSHAKRCGYCNYCECARLIPEARGAVPDLARCRCGHSISNHGHRWNGCNSCECPRPIPRAIVLD